MIAIRISQRNREAIRRSITEEVLPAMDLDAMIEEYSRHINGPIYFIPFYPNPKNPNRGSWATVPYTNALENYEFDESLIDNQFVSFNPR